MAAVLDISRIEKELQQINQQRSETRERLDALRGNRGRGRGPPGGGGRGVFSRLGDNSMNGGAGPRDPAWPGRPSVFDRLYSQGSRGSAGPSSDRPDRDVAAAAADGGSGRQPLGKRLSSRISGEVVVPTDAVTEEADRERSDAAPAGRKRLLSAVVVNGQARQLSGSFDREEAEPAPEPEERPLKRPTLAVDDKTKRRAARMFGTLLVGTLQKFQNDEQAFKRTGTAQRRAEMERRAQERAEAEAQRLREQAATAHREEREAKLNALHDLNLQAEVKALELRYAKRIQQRQQLGGFCVTTTEPPLYWLPKHVSKESQPLLQQADEALEAWKQAQLQALEAERAELTQAAAAKHEAALARLAARQHPGAGEGDEDGTAGNGADRSEGEDGAEEDEQQDQEQETGYALGEEQQGGDDIQDAAAAEGADEQQQEEERQPRVRGSRRVGSDDEDEERLLNSDDE